MDGWEALEIFEGFGSKKSRPEGSVIEGYMEYQMMVYIIQYLPNLATKTNTDCIWDLDSIKKFEGEYLVGKGRFRKVKGNKLWDVIVVN